MAVLAVLTPLALLAVLVALGRYEELMLPPVTEEPDAPGAQPPAGREAPPARPVKAAVRPVTGARPPQV